MSENNIDNSPNEREQPEISVNTHDGAVTIEEADRTVFLTENQAFVAEKPVQMDIAPSNRPRKVYMGMWGPPEIGVVAAASLVVVSAIAAYFFFTLPARNELEQNKLTRNRLETELASARDKYGSITSVEGQVAKLVSSVDHFESNYLPVASSGRTALYQRVNNLIAAHGLVNTSGPDFAPLEVQDAGKESTDQERGRARFRSLFPGAYVTMTLEGPYANLREFIREIEVGQDFMIISSVELEPSDSTGNQRRSGRSEDDQPADNNQGLPPGFGGPGSGFPGPRQTAPAQKRPTGKTHGQIVSLRMEMAAYFRRPNMEAQPATAQ